MMENDELVPVQFAVVKFVPDLLRNEPINVGILARYDRRLTLRIIPRFGRVKSIAQLEDTDSLETALDFLRSTIDRTQALDIETIVEKSTGMIRFSDQCAALVYDPSEYIDEQYEDLVGANAPPRSHLGMNAVAVKDRVRRLTTQRGVDVTRFAIPTQRQFQGQTGSHKFDYGFKNGHTTLVKALSLQNEPRYALREVRDLGYASLDMRNESSDTQIAAIIAPPIEQNGLYDQAMAILRRVAKPLIILDAENNARDPSEEILDLFAHENLHQLPNDLFVTT